MRLTIVTGSFAADHKGPYGKHRHGHDWHVRAALAPSGHKDGAQARLDRVLAVLDHAFLDALVPEASNEGVAEWIAAQLDCGWTYVWRYDKGREFGGWWQRDRDDARQTSVPKPPAEPDDWSDYRYIGDRV